MLYISIIRMIESNTTLYRPWKMRLIDEQKMKMAWNKTLDAWQDYINMRFENRKCGGKRYIMDIIPNFMSLLETADSRMGTYVLPWQVLGGDAIHIQQYINYISENQNGYYFGYLKPLF